MTESEFYGKSVAPNFSNWGDHVRIENGLSSGCPDINYAFVAPDTKCVQGWCETKVVKGNFLYFEKFQLPWMQKRLRATSGRHVWVLAYNPTSNAPYLYSAKDILAAPRENYRKWTRIRIQDVTPVAVASWRLIYQSIINN